MRRSSDKLAVTALLVSLIVAAVVGVFGYPTLLDVNRLARENRELTERIVEEGRQRRDQSCTQSEREHLAKVERLWRTYEYLADLPRSEWGTPLTVAIVRQLPQVEEEARIDVAPAWCDEPQMGLPEPDPELPRRRNFDRLLEKP